MQSISVLLLRQVGFEHGSEYQRRCHHRRSVADRGDRQPTQFAVRQGRFPPPALPVFSGTFRDLLSVHSRYGLHGRQFPQDPLHGRLQSLHYLYDCSDCYRLERQTPGGGSHPLKDRAFARRTNLLISLPYFNSVRSLHMPPRHCPGQALDRRSNIAGATHHAISGVSRQFPLRDDGS